MRRYLLLFALLFASFTIASAEINFGDDDDSEDPSPNCFEYYIKRVADGKTDEVSAYFYILTDSTCELGWRYKNGKADASVVPDDGIGEITIPETVTYNDKVYKVVAIGDEAFYNSTKLTAINYPKSVVRFGKNAFYNTSIQSITIYDNFQSFGTQPFGKCSSLKKADIYCDLDIVKGMFDGSALENDAVNKGNTDKPDPTPTGRTEYKNREFEGQTITENVVDGVLQIPSTVTEIHDYAFRNSKGFKKIIIPENVNYLGASILEGCTELEEVELHDQCSWINDSQFKNCSNLKKININTEKTDIQKYAFQGCTSLTSIEIPSSVTKIEDGAFQGCTGFSSFTVPSTVTELGANVFKDCSNLSDITLNCKISRIPSGIFSGTAIKNFNFDGIGYIESQAFSGSKIEEADFSKSDNMYVAESAFSDCKSLKEVKCATKTQLKDGAFQNCTGLEKLHLNGGVTVSGYNLSTNATSQGNQFKGCTNIKELVFDEGYQTLANNMFYGCTGLTKVTLPSTFINLGLHAFGGCNNLKYIDCSSATKFSQDASRIRKNGDISGGTVISPEEHGFDNVPASTLIYLPNEAGGISSYQNNRNRNIPNTIIKDADGDGFTCNNFVYYPSVNTEIPHEFTAKQMTISGRTLKSDSTLTMSLPFAVNDVSTIGAKAYEYKGVKNGVVYIKKVSATEANKPYLIVPNNAYLDSMPVSVLTEDESSSAKPVVLRAESSSTPEFVGVDAATTVNTGYIFDGKNFVKVNKPTTLKPTEAYLAISDTEALPDTLTTSDNDMPVNVEGDEVAISEKWGTFCSPVPVDFTEWEKEGVEAYYVSTINRDYKIILTKLTYAPANTGIILYNPNETTHNLTIKTFTGRADINEDTKNYLVGCLKDTNISQTDENGNYVNYILTRTEDDNELKFYKVNTEGNTIKAGKAYLHLRSSDAESGSEAAKYLSLGFDDATGIKSITGETEAANERIYDLSGRYVGNSMESLYPGFYIRNGKKLLKKNK